MHLQKNVFYAEAGVIKPKNKVDSETWEEYTERLAVEGPPFNTFIAQLESGHGEHRANCGARVCTAATVAAGSAWQPG